MSQENKTPPARTYRWPWFVLAAVILGFVVSVLTVRLAVKKIERERNFSAPLPGGSSTN